MPRTRKPRIFKGPAAQYAGPTEAVYEVSVGDKGGLVSLRSLEGSGRAVVELYRFDPEVELRVPAPEGREDLQELVNLAYRKPEEVDTGHLINALDLALAMLKPAGINITIPNRDEADRFGNVDCPDCSPHDDTDCTCETCSGTGYVAG
jgi:hypothetical protein